jgi:hypothetical protein
MSGAAVLEALAEALDAASLALKRRSALLAEEPERSKLQGGAVARARVIHPLLGPRQAEVVEQLERAGRGGTNTGVISRAIDYEQPNVYLTLRGLITLGFVEKDESATPHRYRLTRILSDEELEG